MNSYDGPHPTPTPIPARLSADNVAQHRSDFRRLLEQYRRLAWCTSAVEQRERTALQQPLMELYRILHPASLSVHLDDDFDTLLRGRRRE